MNALFKNALLLWLATLSFPTGALGQTSRSTCTELASLMQQFHDTTSRESRIALLREADVTAIAQLQAEVRPLYLGIQWHTPLGPSWSSETFEGTLQSRVDARSDSNLTFSISDSDVVDDETIEFETAVAEFAFNFNLLMDHHLTCSSPLDRESFDPLLLNDQPELVIDCITLDMVREEYQIEADAWSAISLTSRLRMRLVLAELLRHEIGGNPR